MDSVSTGNQILKEIQTCFSQLDKIQIALLKERILKAKRIFFIGAGRSRLMLSAFCMRLNHLGFEAYIAGAIPCPPASIDDLVIAASGSGRTPSVLSVLGRLKNSNIPIFIITALKNEEIDHITDDILVINAPHKLENSLEDSTQLMRALFEQMVFLIGEIIVFELSIGKPEIEIIARHTNLE